MTRVLIAEDETALRSDLVDYLTLRGLDARGAATAKEWSDQLDAFAPDIVILDIGLPDGNGFELADRARKSLDCGVIMLTARGDAEDRIRGFQSGADIYLVKNSTLREVEAAILSLHRRLHGSSRLAAAERNRAWSLNRQTWTLYAPGGEAIRLTSSELAFLAILIENGGEPSTRAELAAAMARPGTYFDDHHLDVAVSRLRKKIKTATPKGEAPIRSAYGVGYAFSAPAKIQD